MNPKADKHLIIISGATATGKTALAEALADELNCPIINADSRQIYKDIPIGTAQPSEESLKKYEYLLTGFLPLTEKYNAGKYAEDCINILTKIYSRKNIAILCGGTGLYIKTLLEGIDELPLANEELRTELQEKFSLHGIEYLQQRIPANILTAMNDSDKKNPRRLMRKIEIAESIVVGRDANHGQESINIQILTTGSKGQRLVSSPTSVNFFKDINVKKYIVDLPREELYSRINFRVEEMIKSGFEQEAKNVFQYRNFQSLNAVGFPEWFDYFDGKISYDECISLIKQHTRNYAKRQLTWFRKDLSFKPMNDENEKSILNFILNQLK